MFFLLYLNLFISQNVFSFDQVHFQQNEIDEVAGSPAWLKLLHYKPRFITGAKRSLIDGQGFFFSPDGKTDAKAELIASLGAFNQDMKVGRYQLHPQCAFPERYRFLKEKFDLKYKNIDCPKFKEFLSQFKANSLSLVFSSASPNNPGSMFGHTFLKVNSSTSTNELLDYGVNFAAGVSKDENGFAFVVFGMTGGYRGIYSIQPYYTKVNEYTNSESRDLWEYQLSLTPEESNRVLAHIWEIDTNTYFDYFFFDENCSYQLLASIEAIKPEWELTNFPIYVIPGESVKKITDIPGAVTKVSFRPSLQKQMALKYASLSSTDRHLFEQVIDRKIDPARVQSPSVLNASALYVQYKRQKNGELDEDDKDFRRRLLARRSEIGVVSDEPAVVVGETRPDLGHDSYRLAVLPGVSSFGGLGNSSFIQTVSLKSAYHDLMNYDLGYSRYSHIDFPALDLRYYAASNTLNIEKITGVEVTSLFPLSFIEKRISWKFSIYSYSPKDFGCTFCHVIHGDGGAGATVEITHKLIFYGLALMKTEIGNSLGLGYRWGPSLQTAFLGNPFPKYKIRLLGELNWDVAQTDRSDKFYRASLDQSLSLARNWESRVSVEEVIPTGASQKNYNEMNLNLSYYFN